jgi:dihydrofolate reductase
MITLIVAMTEDRVIGKGGGLPWRIPEDLKLFKKTTMGHVVVMGRKTFESMGSKPLPGRKNIVISKTLCGTGGLSTGASVSDLHFCKSFEEGIEKARALGEEIFIIGGASLFEKAMPMAERMIISWVKKRYEGDVYFPAVDQEKWQCGSSEEYPEFTRTVYQR